MYLVHKSLMNEIMSKKNHPKNQSIRLNETLYQIRNNKIKDTELNTLK